MRVLESPKPREKDGPRPPGFWAKVFHPVGTVVEHEGHVWRLGGDQAGSYWEYIDEYPSWDRDRREAIRTERAANAPKVGPKGGAGGSKAARR